MTIPPRRLGVGGALILLVWLASFGALLARTVPVSGDGIYYFVQLESILVDGDVDFANNLERFRDNPHVAKQLDSGVTTPTGRTPNLFAVGPAVVWAPVYLLATALPFNQVTNIAGTERLAVDLLAPSIATSLVVLVGLLAAYGTCRRLGISGRAAGIGVAVGFIGTSLVYYATVEASMAHGIGFGLVSLLLYVAIRLRQSSASSKKLLPWLGLGVLAGLIVAVRWQLLLVSVPIALYAWWPSHVEKTASQKELYWQQFVFGVFGFVIGFLPQLLVWKSLYGEWLVIPQGSGFIVPTSPHFGEVLISSRHGLLSWTPLVLVGIVGLFIAARWRASALRSEDNVSTALPGIAALLFVVLFFQIYANGSLIEWWGGDAFGGRRFSDIAVVWMVGLAVLAHISRTWRRWTKALAYMLVTVAVLVNVMFIQIYRHGEISRSNAVSAREVLTKIVETLQR